MATFEKLTTEAKPTWCPGCGDFGILMAIKHAMEKLELHQHETVMVGGIGCSGKMPYWVNVNAFAALHGRALPVATGIKLANNNLNVFVNGGDGDGYGIGVGHLIHALRRNLDITYLVHNNQVYGLTKGQTSPTSDHGFKTNSTPDGVIEEPLNPMTLALAAHGTFVARGYAGDVPHLTNLIVQASKHKGFALLDILQPCYTFNHVNTYDWYGAKIYKLEDTDYAPHNKEKAFVKALEWGDKIPIGVLYQEKHLTYEQQLPEIQKKALVDHDISRISIDQLLAKMR